jgi:hypothetical protein
MSSYYEKEKAKVQKEGRALRWLGCSVALVALVWFICEVYVIATGQSQMWETWDYYKDLMHVPVADEIQTWCTWILIFGFPLALLLLLPSEAKQYRAAIETLKKHTPLRSKNPEGP